MNVLVRSIREGNARRSSLSRHLHDIDTKHDPRGVLCRRKRVQREERRTSYLPGKYSGTSGLLAKTAAAHIVTKRAKWKKERSVAEDHSHSIFTNDGMLR